MWFGQLEPLLFLEDVGGSLLLKCFWWFPRLSLRVFSDPADPDKMWKANVKDIDGDILCVSQFTLLANTTKGNKPDFHRAMVRIIIHKFLFIVTFDSNTSLGVRTFAAVIHNLFRQASPVVQSRKGPGYVLCLLCYWFSVHSCTFGRRKIRRNDEC